MAKTWWIADATFVTPPSTDMIAGEDIRMAINATPILAQGETVAGATSKLIRLDTGAEVSLGADTPSVASPTITQRIRNLEADTTYLLHVFATIGQRVQSMSLVIECNT